MKKILVLAICCLSISVVSSAFAAYVSGTITMGSSAPTLPMQLSNTVNMDYAGGTNGVSFNITSYHGSGTRTYQTTSGDSKIYFQNATAVALIGAPATASASAGFVAAGWTAL